MPHSNISDRSDLRSMITVVITFGILTFAGLACGGSGKPAPPEYVGTWTGNDQSTMTIRADGGADYKSANTSVNGGSAVFDDAAKTLKISFMRIGPSFTIDKAPSGNQMTLSGVIYHRDGPGSTGNVNKSNSSNTPAAVSDVSDLPPDQVVQRLVRSSVSDLADAIEQDDFSDLYNNASSDFRSTYTIDQVKDLFKSFVEKKADIGPILKQADSAEVNFSPAVSIRTEKGLKVLVASGSFDTTPATLNFETEYVNRGGEWKMLTLLIKIK
ncbi:MAG: hypothetical protein ABJA02_08615 [Acidobacteriota bacterium]